MKKLILKHVQASIMSAATLLSAGTWANTQIPVSISYSASSTSITPTTLSNVPSASDTCSGASACQGVAWSGDPAACSGGGITPTGFGGSQTTWATGVIRLPATSPSTLFLTIAAVPSPGSLAYLLCPSGTSQCHVCICTNSGQTATDGGTCSNPSGTVYPDSCTGTGQPVFNSPPATLTLTCP